MRSPSPQGPSVLNLSQVLSPWRPAGRAEGPALVRRPASQRAGWRMSASMRATRVRAGGWDAARRERQPIGRRPISLASSSRNALASSRPKPMRTARRSASNSEE